MAAWLTEEPHFSVFEEMRYNAPVTCGEQRLPRGRRPQRKLPRESGDWMAFMAEAAL